MITVSVQLTREEYDRLKTAAGDMTLAAHIRNEVGVLREMGGASARRQIRHRGLGMNFERFHRGAPEDR
jgi:hypothetical protein